MRVTLIVPQATASGRLSSPWLQTWARCRKRVTPPPPHHNRSQQGSATPQQGIATIEQPFQKSTCLGASHVLECGPRLSWYQRRACICKVHALMRLLFERGLNRGACPSIEWEELGNARELEL